MPKESLYYTHYESFKRLTLGPSDPRYPEQLKRADHVNPTLYIVGHPEILKTPLISIIGARKATPYGLACAQMAGRIAAECGITVVSGGAIGCDSEAARSCLEHGGKTIVVPGCGPDLVYPSSSDDLYYEAVVTGGCILTNLEWGQNPTRKTFVSRNAIIAGLSRALIVCEAGIKSGTFTTATMAAELGRRVYAIPGSIYSATARGTNHLLENGASIICDEEGLEALISLDYNCMRFVSAEHNTVRSELIAALIANPMDAAAIAAFTRKSIPETFTLLSDYEAAGIIERQMDGKYSPTAKELQKK